MKEKCTQIVIVRHGETQRNTNNLLISREEDPLNKSGKHQAHLLRNRLKQYKFTAFYSSPLSRAYETAQIVAKSNNIVVKDNRITERNFGSLEGLSIDTTKGDREDFYNAQSFFSMYNPHNIETVAGTLKINQLV